jgi:hypothetical protein
MKLLVMFRQTTITGTKTQILNVIRSQDSQHMPDTYKYPCAGLDRPQGLLEVEALRIFRQSAHDSGKVVSPAQQPPLHPR